MAMKQIGLSGSTRQTLLAEALGSLAVELELPESFPPAVLAEAEAAVAAQELPVADATDVAFVTIDPPTSTDLDQAVHLERAGDGYTVRYAIADVPSFVAVGGALDAETRLRGQTLYLPQGRIPLHPDVIGEQAGSLLPEQVRSAYLWTFRLGPDGSVLSSALERAGIRSRAKLSYEGVQAELDAGTADECLQLLREVGLKRIRLEHERGGASLRLPEQEVELDDAGHYRLTARAPLPVEDWNAQISLMTGMEAARIMLEGRVGILRTMPAPDERSVAQFRRQAAALGCPWPRETAYGDFLRSLELEQPKHLALMHAATSLFRGASYTAFDGGAPPEADAVQSAIAAPYAHATAPLRRLVDRFVLMVCLSLSQESGVPEEVRAALPLLPDLMQSSNRVAGTVERASIDAVEAALLHGRVGERFTGTTIDGPSEAQAAKAAEDGRLPTGTIQLLDPPITARYEGRAELGTEVEVELVTADIARREVLFRIAAADGRAS
ncbi:RNB domain-containing ribonuclease [Zafaria sp. Z1313]|uniref:RNB domain-containing ribonuclease n=1 Tax=Zafaria sp. Z1313 TaxID=3423202 RepID=UPI003D3036FD